MYKTVPKKRKKLIRESGNIIMTLPESRFMHYCSQPFEIIYECKGKHGANLNLFIAEAVAADGMLLFNDVEYHKDSEGYPSEVLDELCQMVVEEMELYAIISGHDVMMVTTEIPFFPEIWLERKYDISRDEYNTRKSGWRAMKELWDE